MRKILVLAAFTFTLACLMPVPAVLAAEAEGGVVLADPGPPGPPLVMGRGMHRIGLGVNYWKTIDNLDQDVTSDGFSYILSYQYAPVWFVKVGTNLELFPDLAASTDPVIAPELFVTFGGLFYGGVGIGIYYHDGNWGNAPFYMFRAGLDLPILPRLFLDINANYRFNDWDTLNFAKDIGTDTIRLGAAVRFVL